MRDAVASARRARRRTSGSEPEDRERKRKTGAVTRTSTWPGTPATSDGLRGAMSDATITIHLRVAHVAELRAARRRECGQRRRGRLALSGNEPGRDASRVIGVRLGLESAPERLHWAKIVTRAREAFERDRLRVSNLVS